MKVDFRKKLVSQKKDPLEKMEKGKKIQMTLGDVCSEALLGFSEQDKNEGGKTKYERWQLNGRIINTKETVEVTSEEVTLIKERVGKMYGPIVVGPVYELLENREI